MCYLCIHGHFYQPPREDPFTGRIPRESGAAPYANWNERIAAECYGPLAEAGHFDRISFNLGSTLAWWLDSNDHAVYQRVLASEATYYNDHGASNGLAQPVYHIILPLARRRDKICQVRWGIADFTQRFRHPPEGMWLPEMAVDIETLEILVSEGIQFTILSEEQVEGQLDGEAGPYWVRLPSGGEIAVFVRDRLLSNALSFKMPDPAEAEEWLEDQLSGRCAGDGLVLAATDGETFGHHHRQGVEVLGRILAAGEAQGHTLTTLGLYSQRHLPQAEVGVIANTSWSCSHRLDRWAVGCDCTEGDSRWKGALRRALDNLACDLDGVYVQEAQRVGVAPWSLRDDYIAVVLGKLDGPTFLAEHDLGGLPWPDQERLLHLLEAQCYRQRMYASCTFFFDDLGRLEPRYAIASAIRALGFVHSATGDDLTAGFRRDLAVAISEQTERTGADILDELLRQDHD